MQEIRSVFSSIMDGINGVSNRLDIIIIALDKIQKTQEKLFEQKAEILSINGSQIITNESLLTLSKPLQETALALLQFEEATAEMICELTKKKRAVESALLNELVRLKYCEKSRKGRNVYFKAKKE